MVLFTKVHKNQSFMFEEFVEITEVFFEVISHKVQDNGTISTEHFHQKKSCLGVLHVSLVQKRVVFA